ncbi:bacterial type serine/tyrosine phosphatase [Cryptosporidium felis]|nr:bacterial type serine/tyrosine phosphatase [Cryptosporidium felis]
MFLSKVPFSHKPLARIENLTETTFEKKVERFVEIQLENYPVEKRKWYKFGFEYYASILLGKRILLDVVPNVRDVTQFLDSSCLKKHVLYRGGRPGGVEPDKLKHIIRDTLGIKTIIDVRGRSIFEDSCLTRDEILSRSVIWKYYNPIFENKAIDKYIQEKSQENIVVNTCREMTSNDVKYLILLNSMDLREPFKVENSERERRKHSETHIDSPFNLSCILRNKYLWPEPGEKEPNNEELLVRKRKESTVPRIMSYTYCFMSLASPNFAKRWYINRYLDLRTIGEVYYDISIFDSLNISRALKVITVSKPPILLHGNLGKDRVSILTAILLLILGVSEEYIIRDYCASEPGLFSIKETFKLEMEPLPECLTNSDPDNLKEFFEKMKREFGGIDVYLDAIGFDSSWRSRLRQKFAVSDL